MARNCIEHAGESVRAGKRSTLLNLFQVAAPLRAVAMDLLGEFIAKQRATKTFWSSPIVSLSYFWLYRKKPTAIYIAKEFLRDIRFVQGAPISILTDNGPQFTAR